MTPKDGRDPHHGEPAQRVIPTAGTSLINAALRVLADGHDATPARSSRTR